MTRLRTAIAAVLTRAAHWIADGHAYLSTSCLHGRHRYCQSRTGSNPAGEQWTKRPGSCKFCGAPCRCSCHRVSG